MKTNKLIKSLIIIAVLIACLFGCAGEEGKNKSTSGGKFCSVSINCKDIFDNLDDFDIDKVEILPEDGIIFADKEIEINDNDTVMSVTEKILKKKKIHIDVLASSLGTSYIRGIGNIYEGDCGNMSGWSYKVNGESPDVGADNYKISNGDKIEWVYICNWDME